MILTQLVIQHFRNLLDLEIQPGPQFNLIIGMNGSGKTSLLEAIYFLALGRSFRTHLLSRVITHHQAKCILFSRLLKENNAEFTVGVEKFTQGKRNLHVNGEIIDSAAEVVRLLPLQFINHESHSLLDGGPKERRAFMDWGMFHVEHQFFPVWKRMMRALQQRNAALRAGINQNQIASWDNELIESGLQIDRMREQYLQEYFPLLMELINRIFGSFELKIQYYRGWNHDLSLKEALNKALVRDREAGNTSVGTHRADLKILCNSIPAQDVLSRGQQKLLVSVMRLAQGVHLKKVSDQRCIYLIDDLPAELDQNRREQLAQILKELEAQVFISGISEVELQNFNDSTTHSFNVEAGVIYPS